MKVLLFVTLYFLFHEISAFSVNKIEQVKGLVKQVQYDSDGNIYAVANLSSIFYIHKLNPSKELLWTVPFPRNVTSVMNMYITKEKNIYFHIYVYEPYTHYFAILRSDSTKIETVEDIDYSFYFIDDNLFYSNKDKSACVFKPNSNASVVIKNLEYFILSGRNAIKDKFGNIYLANKDHVALISKNSLQQEKPSATLTKLTDSDGEEYNLYIDDRNDLWIILQDITSPKGEIKKLRLVNVLESIKTDTGHPFLELVMTKNKVFVIAPDLHGRVEGSNIYYITLDNEVMEIPELSYITLITSYSKGIADSEGNVFIYSSYKISHSLGAMIVIKQNETKPIPITFEGVSNVEMDFNEDKWISANDGLYYLEKGQIVPQKINNVPDTCKNSYREWVSAIINYIGKEIYFPCLDGLYVVVKD